MSFVLLRNLGPKASERSPPKGCDANTAATTSCSCNNKTAGATTKTAAAVFEMLQTHYAYYPRFKHIGLATFFLTTKSAAATKTTTAAVVLE